jgi:hypothetical protein
MAWVMIRLTDIHRQGGVKVGQRYFNLKDGRIYTITNTREGYRLHRGVVLYINDIFVEHPDKELMERFVALRG